jgi:eukaryotic-like serine/threonine-protein kinase
LTGLARAVILGIVSISQRDDELALRARARVGQVLKEKWRLDKLLGVGGMASVYAATHRNTSRVAVKMLHVEFSLDKNIRARFQREGYVANSVGHPGAVRVIDDDVADDGSVFLVMELLEGETVDARWARKGRKLPAEEVLAVADQLLDVLAGAHAHGIVHRDIKPENIFLTQEGIVKILDFGIARVQELAAGSNATRPGSSMGTPAFMPPEQALGRSHEVDARSDIWATGATMFTLLSGELVHQGATSNEQLVRAATAHAPSLASVLPDALPLLVEVVDRALQFEKADRWSTAAAMQEAIGRACC